MNGDSVPRRVLTKLFGVQTPPAVQSRPPAIAGHSVARRVLAELLGVRLPQRDRAITHVDVERGLDEAAARAAMGNLPDDAPSSKTDSAKPTLRAALEFRRPRVVLAASRHHKRIKHIIMAVIVVVTGATIVALPAPLLPAPSLSLPPDDACGGSDSGVREIAGECVGVTDGSYVYNESFTDIQNKIAEENRKVSGSGHTVTIALLDPLTVTGTSAVTVEQVRNELEGAYTAQYRFNLTGVIGDQRPLVKLVLANWGSHGRQWQPVVEQLEGMVDDPDPLVAVVGLRLSTVQTRDAALHLSQHNIPMVSSLATADQLNYGAIPGFLRASPPNSEYVAAIQAYLRNRPDLDSAMMVYDTNSDLPYDPNTGTGSDLFIKSLRDDFDTSLAHLENFPEQGFMGKSGPTGGSPNLFTNVTANVCAVQPKIVLYAGRVGDFTSFLQSLHNRACPDTPLTVIAAASDFGVLQLRSQEAELRDKNLTIVYATETDAQGWVRGAPGTPGFFQDFYNQFRELGFDPAHLDEGSAISTHDALLTAAKAARLFTRSHPDQALRRHNDVLTQELNLNGQNAVPGAAGQLSFSSRGADSGNPSNKPIPVIEVPSAAAAQTPEVYHTR